MVVVIGLAAGGLAAVVATGRMLMRTWSWGLVAGAVLVAIPVWTGHAMFNVKDVPVAIGYAVFTCGLVLGAARSPSRTRDRRPWPWSRSASSSPSAPGPACG